MKLESTNNDNDADEGDDCEDDNERIESTKMRALGAEGVFNYWKNNDNKDMSHQALSIVRTVERRLGTKIRRLRD